MNVLYLDIFSGISGDMFIGAMIDLGVDPTLLEKELAKLPLRGYHLHWRRAKRCEIEGVKYDVHLAHEHGHAHEHEHGHSHEHEHPHEHGHAHAHTGPLHPHGRNHAEIKALIARSDLSAWVRAKALAVFQRIAIAEGKIHGTSPDDVQFHEVGAVDSIVDIVGACVALDLLGRPRVLSARVVEGSGWIQCAHGRFPLPAPATLEIFAARGLAITQTEEPGERITPTGAALLAEFAGEFGPMRNLAPVRVGIGVGTREYPDRPNVLRAILGHDLATPTPAHDWESDTIAVLETNLDDLSSEILGHFIETALAAGALDVFFAPIQMKKNRPGVILSVLCAVAEADKFTEMILRQTSAFGVRRSQMERWKLRREFREVATPHGPVTIKLGLLDGYVVQIAPEFAACKKLALEKNLPLTEIYRAALAAWKS